MHFLILTWHPLPMGDDETMSAMIRLFGKKEVRMPRPVFTVGLFNLLPPNVHREARTLADDVKLIVQIALLAFAAYVLAVLVLTA